MRIKYHPATLEDLKKPEEQKKDTNDAIIDDLYDQLSKAKHDLSIARQSIEDATASRRRIVIFLVILLVFSTFIAYGRGKTDGTKLGYDSGYSVGYKKAGQSLKEEPAAVAPTTSGSSTSGTSQNQSSLLYIANKKTKVLHYPTCSYLPQEQNRIYIYKKSDAAGYKPCGHCNPRR